MLGVHLYLRTQERERPAGGRAPGSVTAAE